MSNLKDRLIRLGSQKPELRGHLRPVLDHITKVSSPQMDKAKDSLERGLGNYVDTVDEGHVISQDKIVVTGLSEDRPLSGKDLEQGLNRVLNFHADFDVEVVYEDFLDKYSVSVTATL